MTGRARLRPLGTSLRQLLVDPERRLSDRIQRIQFLFRLLGPPFSPP